MVIGQNILDEFMVMDNTFEAVDKDQTPAFVEKRQLSLTEHLGHEYDESSQGEVLIRVLDHASPPHTLQGYVA